MLVKVGVCVVTMVAEQRSASNDAAHFAMVLNIVLLMGVKDGSSFSLS